MNTLKLSDGIVFKDGIDFRDGIDFDGKTRLKGRPRAAKRTREAVLPPVGGHRPARRSGDNGGGYARPDTSHSRWTVTAVYNNYDMDAASRPASKARAVAPNRHVQRYLALSGQGYGRRCSVKIRYTDGRNRPGAGRKLASFAGTQTITSQDDYIRGYIGYIGRTDATMAGDPEYRPDEDRTLFTCDETGRVALSQTEAGLLIGRGDVFTVVISPEDAGFDPAAVAENFVEEFRKHCFVPDKATGKPLHGAPASLKWVAAVHRNTEHTHIHIMIGRETPSGKLRVGRSYTKSGARKDCEDILTDLMGERTWDQELEHAREKALRMRFTTVDSIILKMAGGDREIGKWSIENRDNHTATLIEERLKQLRRWHLATYSRKTAKWTVFPEAEPTLRRFEILKALGMDPQSEGYVVDPEGSDYRGTIVRAVGEEDGSRVFMLIQGEDGVRHLRMEEVGDMDEVIAPEGVVNASDIRALLRHAAMVGRGGRT